MVGSPTVLIKIVQVISKHKEAEKVYSLEDISVLGKKG